jgi:hypothetical protein
MAFGVVEDFEVLEDRGGEFDAGAPSPAGQELDLHARLEVVHHGASEGLTDRSHRWHEPGLACSPREHPRRELGAMVRVDEASGEGCRFSTAIPSALLARLALRFVSRPRVRIGGPLMTGAVRARGTV